MSRKVANNLFDEILKSTTRKKDNALKIEIFECREFKQPFLPLKSS